MKRPSLSPSLPKEEFGRWYWLKSELTDFCQDYGIPSSGSKQEISERIISFLAGESIPVTSKEKRIKGAIPEKLELNTVIGPNWRCTQALRAFFEVHHGKSFHFNEAMRTYIYSQTGRTLADALQYYKKSLVGPKKPIAEQFEYNRHMREFHAKHPGASRAEAIDAWWVKRRMPSG